MPKRKRTDGDGDQPPKKTKKQLKKEKKKEIRAQILAKKGIVIVPKPKVNKAEKYKREAEKRANKRSLRAQGLSSDLTGANMTVLKPRENKGEATKVPVAEPDAVEADVNGQASKKAQQKGDKEAKKSDGPIDGDAEEPATDDASNGVQSTALATENVDEANGLYEQAEVDAKAETKSKKDKKAKKEKRKKEPTKETEGSAVNGMTEAIEPVGDELQGKKEEKKKKKNKKRKESEVEADAEETLDVAALDDAANAVLQAAVSVAQDDEKAAKKAKKEKKDKKDKKRKALEVEPQEEETAAAAEDVATGASEGADAAVSDKKSKKEWRSKKQKKTHDESAAAEAPNDAQAVNGTVDIDMADSTDATPTTSTSSTYQESPALTAVSESNITSFLSTHKIVVTDPTSPKTLRPVTEFKYLPPTTLISKSPFAAFKTPTPIQAASWPFGLAGRDIVGVAETGSGKTMAFGLPCVEAVLRMPKVKGAARIRAVIVSPTRELAMQTNEQLSKLGDLVGLKTVCVYGGAPKDEQRNQLRKADMIVATPGRLKDFLEEGAIKLDNAGFVVLDEADRMLDKGFEDDIKLIIGKCKHNANHERQTLMFTATWPQSVQALASSFMVKPVKIQIAGNESGDLQANTRIDQKVEVIDPHGKEQRLLQILKAQPKNERILVFCLYKKEATRVEGFLQQRGLKVVAIHGDLRQEQRTRSLEAFKTGDTPIMVATDVAARGLDIPEVKLVINVTFPLTIEDYVHRIGRTGRAGKTGHAITLFTEHDKAHSGELVNILRAAGQPVPDELLKFGTTVKKKQHGTYGAFFKDVDMTKKGTKITFD